MSEATSPSEVPREGGLGDSRVLEQAREEMRQLMARYPQPRSALLPMLHLVQAYDGYVTQRGIELCAQLLELSAAEVAGVATFYTMYKRHPMGEYHVGVCTNTLCAVLGGDAIWDRVSTHLGIGHDETTPDGVVSLERVECNAACDYAPVVMVNWEFFDRQSPDSTVALVDALRAGQPVQATRGPRVCTFREAERVIAGFPDEAATQGAQAGEATLRGVRLAHEQGWAAPAMPNVDDATQDAKAAEETAPAPTRQAARDVAAQSATESGGPETPARPQQVRSPGPTQEAP